MNSTLQLILSIPPSRWCEAYFVILGSGCLALQVMPADLRDALLGYGARRTSGNADEKGGKTAPTASESQGRGRHWLVDVLGKLYLLYEVPHAWFRHFYIALLVFLLFWAGEFLLEGRAMRAIAETEARLNPPSGGDGDEAKTMDAARVVAIWGMLIFHAARRAWECFYVMKPSRSPMLGIHWAMSIAFYFVLSVSFWIHASGKGGGSIPWKDHAKSCLLRYAKHFSKAIIAEGSLVFLEGEVDNAFQLFSLVSVFYAASMTQSVCHLRLAGLRKYSLPQEGLFRHLVCPHYTMECIIYLVLALVAAPRGQTLNRTMGASLYFVVANLGVTAHATQVWYAEKFGADKVPRWKMVPFVF